MERLSMKEKRNYKIIEKLANGEINRQKAEVLTGYTKRHINRLLHQFKTIGIESFIHGNSGRSPVNKKSDEINIKLLELRGKEFFDFNYKHTLEEIRREYAFEISYTHLYNLYMRNYSISKEAHKCTKKEMKKTLKNLLVNEPLVDTINRTEVIKKIDEQFAHPRKPSAKYFGEIVEFDASNEKWIDGVKYHLYSAIDNCTGTLLATHIEKEETLRGYLILLHKVLLKHGIPAFIYTDKRNVFSLNRKKDPSIEKDLHTQFGYICKQLGITLECSSEPTFKAKVERFFKTAQSRLIPEMRRANIQNLDEAIHYIENTFEDKFNAIGSSYSNDTKSVFSIVENFKDLNHLLSIKSFRKIDNGHCIKYKNKFYLPVQNNKGVYFRNSTHVLILECFEGNLLTSIGDELFSLVEIEKNKKFSTEFDIDFKKIKRMGGHAPPMTHPYKLSSFQKYVNSVKHLKTNQKKKMLEFN